MTLPTVVIIDDNPAFPVHVWRLLSGTMEFGEHSFPPSRAECFDLELGDGRLSLLWHNAKMFSSTTFAERLKTLYPTNGNSWFVVDVRLRKKTTDDCRAYWSLLREAGIDSSRIYLVSSYDTQVRIESTVVPVHNKTPESLQALRKKIGFREERRGLGPGSNVLVTGAGFEYRTDPSALGLPSTAQILGELGWRKPEASPLEGEPPLLKALRNREAIDPPPKYVPGESARFPSFEGALGKYAYRMHKAAQLGDLDEYWEKVLSAVNDAPRFPRLVRWNRTYADVRCSQLELSLREAFRRAIAKYDIGHLDQSIRAARLDWTAWLSTNYTGFADRAIALSKNNGRPWRCAHTAMEGELLQRELMMGKWRDGERLFVKLHGDIANVHTMAIAASDKSTRSSFAVVPKLEIMYAIASEWLCQALSASQDGGLCTWHIVGHALRDNVLLDTIARVVFRTSVRQHTFRVAMLGTPKEQRGAKKRLAKYVPRDSITMIEEDATRYLRSF